MFIEKIGSFPEKAGYWTWSKPKTSLVFFGMNETVLEDLEEIFCPSPQAPYPSSLPTYHLPSLTTSIPTICLPDIAYSCTTVKSVISPALQYHQTNVN